MAQYEAIADSEFAHPGTLLEPRATSDQDLAAGWEKAAKIADRYRGAASKESNRVNGNAASMSDLEIGRSVGAEHITDQIGALNVTGNTGE